MKNLILRASRRTYDIGLGLLIVRVAVGLIFFVHGWDKVHSIDNTVRMMQTLGLGGAPMAYFIAWLEVLGGLALIFGVATRVLGVVFGIEMAVAVLKIGNTFGFHGYEFPLLLSALSFALAFAGSGKFSLYPLECPRCGGMFCEGGNSCAA